MPLHQFITTACKHKRGRYQVIRHLPLRTLCKDQFGLNNFLRSVLDTVHPTHPFHLICGFQFFVHALTFCHLLGKQLQLFLCLCISVRQIGVQPAGQQKNLIPYWMMFFEIQVQPAPLGFRGRKEKSAPQDLQAQQE